MILKILFSTYMEFSTASSHSQWFALNPLESLELTKNYFRVWVYITMTMPWNCSLRTSLRYDFT